MPDIFDEVAEDLRAERARALLIRYGGLLAGLALAAILAAAGWQAWRWHAHRQAEGVATQFLDAMTVADVAPPSAAGAGPQPLTPAQQTALTTFTQVAANGPAGYRTLARLRAAGLKAGSGDVAGALALWDQVAQDGGADPLLRDLASLLWVQHQIDGGDPAAVLARLKPLEAPDNAWRAMAQEDEALIELRTGATDRARDLLRILANDASAPQGVRGRAGGLLAKLGG